MLCGDVFVVCDDEGVIPFESSISVELEGDRSLWGVSIKREIWGFTFWPRRARIDCSLRGHAKRPLL